MYFFEAIFFSLFFLVVVVMVSAGYWGYSQSKYSLYVCSTKNNMCWGVCYLYPTKVRLRPEFRIRNLEFGIRNLVVWFFFCSKKWKGSDTKLLFVHQLQGCRNRGCRGHCVLNGVLRGHFLGIKM